MIPANLQAMLASRGVDASALGPIEEIRLPAPAVDEARAPVSATGSGRQAPLAVRSDVLAAVGVTAELDDDERTLQLSAPDDLAFTVTTGRDVIGAPAAARVRVRLTPASVFLIESVLGVPLAAGLVDAETIRLQVVHAWPRPPLEAWLAQTDPAESSVMKQPIGEGASRWTDTVIAGRIARLNRSSNGRSRVEAMRAGRDAGPSIAARVWLRELSPAYRGLVERFAIVSARQLATRLERLQEALRPGDAALAAAWRAVCHLRDDLEGVRVLLRESASGEALAAALREADTTGRAIRFSWPSDLDVHDERLQRVAEGDPGAWWGSTRSRVELL